MIRSLSLPTTCTMLAADIGRPMALRLGLAFRARNTALLRKKAHDSYRETPGA